MAFGHNTTAATKMDESEFIVWPRKGFLPTTKEQIDIVQLHFLSLLTQADCSVDCFCAALVAKPRFQTA